MDEINDCNACMVDLICTMARLKFARLSAGKEVAEDL